MLFKIFCIFTFVFFIFSAAYPMNIKSNEIQNLQNGEVLFKGIEQNSVQGSETAILINAPQQRVWQILERKENFTLFVDQIRKAQVLSENENSQLVKTSVKICKILPCFDYVLSFDNSQKYDKMTFKKTDGCFKELFGCFELIPYGQSTILDCQVYADPGFYIPIMAGKSLQSDVTSIMHSIKREAEKYY